jgi:hypothetical protein
MAQEAFKRKLAASLTAGVEGYSRLMAQEEEDNVRTLTAYTAPDRCSAALQTARRPTC